MNERKVTLVGARQRHATAGRVPTTCARREPEDFDTEWLGLTLGIKLVADVNEALAHMREHNAGHSDAILTNDLANAERFVNGAGSAAVYVNASTRFTDGGQFGLGAEVAVSTQMLHARGPMGLTELTSYKWWGRPITSAAPDNRLCQIQKCRPLGSAFYLVDIGKITGDRVTPRDRAPGHRA